MNALRRFISWLRRCRLRLFGTSSVVVVPGVDCAHAVAVDPEATLRRLVLAVGDPERFAEILASFCAGCSTAILAEAAFTLAGIALDFDQADDDQPLPCTCENPTPPQIVAMRLLLAHDSRDDTVLGATLGEVCASCMPAVLVASTRAQAITLTDVSPAWRPRVERVLLQLLDEQ